MKSEMTALQGIERRIQYHIQGAYANILEVGRCLIEAKEGNLVPHGQWEAWVQKTAGMSERSAQRLMQAAREVTPESAMAKLPISKIQTILALPAAERETMAERVVGEDMSLRQLRNEVAALKRKVEDAKLAEHKANETVDQLRHDLNSAISVNRRIAENRIKATAEADRLRAELEEAKKRRPGGISPEAQKEIDRLQAELDEAEERVGQQARLRQQAQQALIEMQSRQARGDRAAEEDLTSDAVMMAVRTFIGTVGYLPHSARVMALDEHDRQTVASYVQQIGQWVDAMRDALSAVVIEGA